jgi:hypothetical protein
MGLFLWALALLPAAALAVTNPAVMDLHLFPNATARGAVCNDGTPSGFYFLPSATGSDVWLLSLDGGFWCWDHPSCSYRREHQTALTSSTGWPSQRGLGGIFSTGPENTPVMRDANRVFIQYCTSDAFVGATGPSRTGDPSDPATWHFRGLAVLLAAAQDLAALGMSRASLVVFSGCSAGGQGVVATKDRFAQMALSVGVTAPVVAIADAGWMLDEDAARPNVAIRDTFRLGMKLWEGQVDAACAAAHPGAAHECLFSPVAMQFANKSTPILVQSNQFDQFQVPWDLAANPPFSPSQLAWATGTYAPEVQRGMGGALLAPPNAAFSSRCFAHCLTFGDDFWRVKIATGLGVSDTPVAMRDAVGAFLAGKPLQFISSCAGFNCSVDCP